MYIELIDLLRCPREHADSWLVAAFNRIEERFVIEGKLGCPICSATYQIADGLVDLREGGEVSVVGQKRDSTGATEDAAIRSAALLDLTKPDSLVVLAGSSSTLSHQLNNIADARVIALNPTSRVQETERVAVVLTDIRLPVAPGSVDGILLDERSAAFAQDAARILRQGGRLIAPTTANLPASFRELARDDNEIVAESLGDMISLSR
jgi:uncharacterized protein YbaR (Trm112 family)